MTNVACPTMRRNSRPVRRGRAATKRQAAMTFCRRSGAGSTRPTDPSNRIPKARITGDAGEISCAAIDFRSNCSMMAFSALSADAAQVLITRMSPQYGSDRTAPSASDGTGAFSTSTWGQRIRPVRRIVSMCTRCVKKKLQLKPIGHTLK